MKKIYSIVCILTISTPLLGLIGRCIDNSEYLKRYDNKQYHFVECYCDCVDTLKPCVKCGHKHMAREQIIISTSKNNLTEDTPIKKQKHTTKTYTTDPYIELTALVKNSINKAKNSLIPQQQRQHRISIERN